MKKMKKGGAPMSCAGVYKRDTDTLLVRKKETGDVISITWGEYKNNSTKYIII